MKLSSNVTCYTARRQAGNTSGVEVDSTVLHAAQNPRFVLHEPCELCCENHTAFQIRFCLQKIEGDSAVLHAAKNIFLF